MTSAEALAALRARLKAVPNRYRPTPLDLKAALSVATDALALVAQVVEERDALHDRILTLTEDRNAFRDVVVDRNERQETAEARTDSLQDRVAILTSENARLDAELAETKAAIDHESWIVCPHCKETRPCGSCAGYARMCDETAELLGVQRHELVRGVEKLRAETAGLVKALRAHGVHDKDCPASCVARDNEEPDDSECECGLATALAPFPSKSDGTDG